MKLKAPAVIAAPAAVVAEVHQTKREGEVMKMRVAQGGLDLSAMDRSQHRP